MADLSTNKRLVAYHISRLQDKDPGNRIKAIKELELIADPEALDILRSIYDTDSDLDVRKAAQDAGRSIFLKNQAHQNGL